VTTISFWSRGRIGLIDPEGGRERYPAFDVPGQANWGVGPEFRDGRVILISYEEGKAWEGKLRTRLWMHDWASGSLAEIATRDRPAPFMVPIALLPGEQRLLAGPVVDGEQRIFTMNLDGSDPVPVTRPGDGFAYGVELSPDGRRLAYHLTGPGGLPYRICACDLDGGNRASVAHQPDRLFFGPRWSPDGEWLVFLGCAFLDDPGHDWADIYLSRPDGSECRAATQGQSHWFGTSHGAPETRGGGSDMIAWLDARSVTYTRVAPGSRTAWEFQPDRPDTDHFNRDYKPELAAGGSHVCRLDPFSERFAPITEYRPRVWDFRARLSPDGRRFAFCRAAVGQPSELWIMDADGRNQRLLTRGWEGMGADHPRWLAGQPGAPRSTPASTSTST
jgi:TolB protein